MTYEVKLEDAARGHVEKVKQMVSEVEETRDGISLKQLNLPLLLEYEKMFREKIPLIFEEFIALSSEAYMAHVFQADPEAILKATESKAVILMKLKDLISHHVGGVVSAEQAQLLHMIKDEKDSENETAID